MVIMLYPVDFSVATSTALTTGRSRATVGCHRSQHFPRVRTGNNYTLPLPHQQTRCVWHMLFIASQVPQVLRWSKQQAKFAELPCFQLEQPNICCCCHLWQREGTAAGILNCPIVPTGAWVGWVGGRQPRSRRVSNSGCGIDIGVRALQVRTHKPGLSKQAGMLLQVRRMADTNQKEVAQEFHLPRRPCSRQSGAGHSSAYLALVLHDLVLLTLAAFSLAPLRFIFS